MPEKARETKALGETNIGLSRDERSGVCALLDGVLADLNLLQVKTRKAHWDVSGPQFYALHKLWDEQYTALAQEIDGVAERVRMLGSFPVATMAGWLERTSLKEAPGRIGNATDTVVALTQDHESLIRTLRDGIDACDDKFNDKGTADHLTGLLRAHESMAWMLRAFVEGENVEQVRETPRVRVAGA